MQSRRLFIQETSTGVAVAQFRSFARKTPAYHLSVVTMMLATIYVFYGPDGQLKLPHLWSRKFPHPVQQD